jgi:hypothetical protein
MAWASTVEVNAPFSTSSLASPPLPVTGSVDIQEDKVFAQLGTRVDREPDRWVLDSGATNHMMGARGAFVELDREIHGTVHFGDGFVVEIEGRGTVVFNCKNGEHRTLTGVYYIPRLMADIISLSQLEEAGCRVIMDVGVLKIFEPEQKLLTRAVRSPTCLVCLSARSTEAAWRWHARYGHLGCQSLCRLAHHDMVWGLPPLEQVEEVCDACLAS